MSRLTLLIALALLALAVAACGGSGDPPATQVAIEVATNLPLSRPVPTDTQVLIPTDTPVPVEPAEIPVSGATELPVGVEEMQELPTQEPADEPTQEPVPVATFGQTEDGLYFRGSPDADALVVTDYSDFL